MNYIWGGMLLIGVVWGTLTGNVGAVSDAVLDSAREAVTLCVTMLGVMGLWMGLMRIAEDAGIVRAVSKKIRPFIRFLFPNIPKDHPANEHITLNCVANILGLGWAATPAGLKAMEALAQLEEERRKESSTVEDRQGERGEAGDQRTEAGAAARDIVWKAVDRSQEKERIKRRKSLAFPRGVASNEMCTFLILNISSLQLLPVNVIAYRAQYGSVNPTAIVAPGILATAVSTTAAIVFCKIMDCRKG